jgi:hypothetical protein
VFFGVSVFFDPGYNTEKADDDEAGSQEVLANNFHA